MANWSFPKLAALTALLGVVAGTGVSVLLPARYVASDTIQIPDAEGARRWTRAAQERVLSRSSLGRIIQTPELNLYPAKRQRLPLDDIIETVRRNDLRITLPDPSTAGRLSVAFSYPEPVVARATASAIAQSLAVEIPRAAGAEGSAISAQVIHGSVDREHSRLRDAALGAACGAGLALALLLLSRRNARWLLWYLLCALAGALIGALAGYLSELPVPTGFEMPAAAACLAILVRVVWTGRGKGVRPGSILAGASVAGGALGAIFALLLPQQYVSHATMRIVPRFVAGQPMPARVPGTADRARDLTDRVLTRSSLAEVIQRPSLDLYRDQRSRQPLEAVMETMRRDLRLETTPHGDEAVLEFSFVYTDRFKAQAVTREFVSKVMEENHLLFRSGGSQDLPGEPVVEVLEPPSLPASPAAPNAWMLMAAGAACLLFVAGGAILIRRQSRERRRGLLRVALAAAGATALALAVISLATPHRYSSSATLRVVSADAGDSTAGSFHSRLGEVLSSSVLVDLIQRPDLNLYPGERSRLPIKDVIQRMRQRDLRVETLKVSAAGRTEAVRITFQYPDPEKARALVQGLVSRLVEAQGLGAVDTVLPEGRSQFTERPGQPLELPHNVVTRGYVEVVEPPSVDAPVRPRTLWIGAGIVAGLLLSLAAFRLHPPRSMPPAAPTAA